MRAANGEGTGIPTSHWGSSGFADTELDMQLKQHSISHVIIIGLLKYAQELGYHITLVRDATAAFSPEMMYAAHELNGPTYAHAILKTSELIAALPAA